MAVTHSAKRLLIADDHRIVREGLKQLLADAPDLTVVGEAQDGDDTVARVEALVGDGLDAVLLDIALPGRDGLDVLQTIKARWPQLPVLMLSTYPERHYAARCLSLGAAGYLNKSADADVIIAAARKVASGGVYVTEAGGQALAAALHGGRTKAGQGAVPGSGARASAVAQGVDSLSHREHQVYRLLVEGMSVGQIGAQLGLASNTVSTYRVRVLEKTGAKNEVELARLAERTQKAPEAE
jgi:two-component system, NarL family, invasion response regulator UvrY